MLKEYDDIKEEIKNLKSSNLFIKQFYHIVWCVEQIQNTESKKPTICKDK